MSREVKRVPLDFAWPLKETWFGYVLGVKVRCGHCHMYGHAEDCPLCDGDGYIMPEIDVPEGKGWQMWETTSEGSPISPVFETPEELAKWLAETKASTLGDSTATYEQWLAMIRKGWALSAAYSQDKGLRSGVEASS